jgi:NADPH:quinone reductase
MIKAVRVHQLGGVENLKYEDVEIGEPGAGEVLLRHRAIGLNFVDVGMRAGLYPLKPELPFTLGMEAMGEVERVGPGVTGFSAGDRVSHCMVPGAYAEKMLVKADRLISVPDNISNEIAAAATLQGLTAEYLLRSCYAVQPGDTVLIQAAAGGMGLLLCQWAKHLGATVLGTVSTDAKAEIAAAHGCDHPIVYSRENFVDRVAEITGGAGVKAVYDAVGKDTFEGGLASLGVCGHMVSYGNSSGPVAPVNITALGPKSQTITRGALGVFVADPVDRARRANDLWSLIAGGQLKIEINQSYKLADVAQAHAALEGRTTTGSSILMP